eukprot:6201802-Pleurochrysis_carterae.AAC.1
MGALLLRVGAEAADHHDRRDRAAPTPPRSPRSRPSARWASSASMTTSRSSGCRPDRIRGPAFRVAPYGERRRGEAVGSRDDHQVVQNGERECGGAWRL